MKSTGGDTIAAAGVLQLDDALNVLNKPAGLEFDRSELITSFSETIESRSSEICLSQSTNKVNLLWMTAEPLPEGRSEGERSSQLSANQESCH